MMELVQSAPAVDVAEAEFQRLLGYPRDAVPRERARELADWAREWYRCYGSPWLYVRGAKSLILSAESVDIDGVAFHGGRLRSALQQADAHTVFLAAASAGPEAEEEARRLWRDDRPDEYFFLETFASAVVESLVAAASAAVCAWAGGEKMAVLPHHSPGYSQWDVSEQGRLLRVIGANGAATLPGLLEALDSGSLRPGKSQLAVIGVTCHAGRVASIAGLVPCRQCSLANCQYRRTNSLAPHHTDTYATNS